MDLYAFIAFVAVWMILMLEKSQFWRWRFSKLWRAIMSTSCRRRYSNSQNLSLIQWEDGLYSKTTQLFLVALKYELHELSFKLIGFISISFLEKFCFEIILYLLKMIDSHLRFSKLFPYFRTTFLKSKDADDSCLLAVGQVIIQQLRLDNF